jgi:hypothetical protein
MDTNAAWRQGQNEASSVDFLDFTIDAMVLRQAGHLLLSLMSTLAGILDVLPCLAPAQVSCGRLVAIHCVTHLALVQENERERTYCSTCESVVDVVVKVCREVIEVERVEETRVGQEHKWFSGSRCEGRSGRNPSSIA